MTDMLSTGALPVFPTELERWASAEDDILVIEEKVRTVARIALDLQSVLVMETALLQAKPEKETDQMHLLADLLRSRSELVALCLEPVEEPVIDSANVIPLQRFIQ